MLKISRIALPLMLSASAVVGTTTISLGGQNDKPNTEAKASISLSLLSTKNVFKSSSLIRVTVTMTNISNHEIFYWRENADDPSGFEYKIDILKGPSPKSTDTKFGRYFKGREDPAQLTPDTPLNGSGGWRTLKAGDKIIDTVNISKMYDLSQAGSYEIQLRRFDEESKAFVKSNTITITITP